MKRLLMLLLVPALVAIGDGAFAQGRGKGQSKPKEAKKEATRDVQEDKKAKAKGSRGKPEAAVVVIDRDGHHRVIREYYTREALPPGLAKRAELPPGLRRQLRENGALPPGLEKHWVPVPASVVRLLPPVPAHYERYFVGNDLVIVDAQRHTVVQIVPDVLPPLRR